MLKNINIKPDVLKKLIETSGYETEEIAKKLKIKEVTLKRILNEGQISHSQLKKIANILKRPLAAFFSDDISSLPAIPDYRLNRNKKINAEVFLARRKLTYLIDKLKYLSNKKSIIPEFEKNLTPVQYANEFRKYLDINILKDLKPSESLDKYKKEIETKLNIVIIEYPLKSEDVRAFSIYSELAGIVLNENDHPSVKLFSLFHEVCHLLRKSSGICSLDYETETIYNEEYYCNQFSAEFLVPSEDLNNDIKLLQLKISSDLDNSINILSKIYPVSKEVILRRLRYLNYLSSSQFTKYKEQLEKREKKKQSGYRKWDIVYKNRAGYFVLNEIKSAFSENKITFYEALDILDVNSKYAEEFLYEPTPTNKSV